MSTDAHTPGFAIRTDRQGFALLIVMLVTMVVAAIAAGAALIGANTFLINEHDQRQSLLETVADAGIELGRARLNANPGLYNDTAVATLEMDAAVTDAGGTPIPNVTRTVHVLPLGGGAGEYGNFAALVAIARDGDGGTVIRRLDLIQESFATFAYFTDFEAANIAFGLNDQLYGPVHSNSKIEIRNTGATFHGPVTTSDRFIGAQYATFKDDTTSNVPRIMMPGATQITRLQDRASPGHMSLTAPAAGGPNQAGTRIEFVARDLDGSGVRTGFIRVYRSDLAWWVTGNVPPGNLPHGTMLGNNSRACGYIPSDHRFRSDPGDQTAQRYNLTHTGRRCFLGGADTLWTRSHEGNPFRPVDERGQWLPYPGDVHPAVVGQRDAAYLWPLDRRLNPGFRGVIYVDGTVVVSGTVRSRVTLAATGNIIIGDDLVYDTDPGSGSCRDALGLFSGGNVVVADNMLNTPQQLPGDATWRVYDETPHEFIHGTIMALNQFVVENSSSGPTSAVQCDGQWWGRGCLHVNGGLIQRQRGAVGTGSGHGYGKRYTFDQCAYTDPPPYFPGTGHFTRSRYYEVDPTGFDIQAFFNALN